MSLPFDEVFLVEDGVARPITLEAYRELDLSRRVRLLLEDKIRFRLGGEPVKTADALKHLAHTAARR